MRNQTSVFVCALGLLGASIAATAQEMPRRKPGLWESTMSSPQMQGRNVVSQQCVDEKTDADMLKRTVPDAGKESSCTRQGMTRLANGWEFDTVCKQADGTLTMHAKITGDFGSQYKMEVTGHRTPPKKGMAEIQSTMTARHLGACPADMKPGDMKINGMLMHADGMPANMTPQQAEQMKKMMEQMKKQMKQHQQ
ncbi:MAG: hypothetical protein JWL63_906 [Rhodocyclales bacterium]|nr:hypothetical protein [Rhodocyclales bacterium]